MMTMMITMHPRMMLHQRLVAAAAAAAIVLAIATILQRPENDTEKEPFISTPKKQR